MKKLVLLLSVVSCLSIYANGDDDCRVPCGPTPISKATTIKKPGCYCVTKNIRGKITIAHNDVTLDLNCHKVNGSGEDAAICADGYSNITIKNGSVCNLIKNDDEPAGFGIDIRNSTDVTLEDLNVVETDPVGMQLIDTTGITIRGCDFSKNDQALLLSGCKSGKVECCKAYNNENTLNEEIFSSAVVSLEFCDCIDVVDFDVCDNVKARTVDSLTQNSIFTVAMSTNVNLKLCKLNSNRLFQEMNFTPGAMEFSLTSNCSAIDCQANNNIAADDSLVAIPVIFSSNFTCVRSQANGNEASVGMVGFTISSVDGYIQEECQASKNSVTGDDPLSGLFGFIAIDSTNGVVRDCSANENSSTRELEAYFILNSGNIQMLNFQGNSNSGTTLAVGILSQFATNIDIIGCQVNNTNCIDDAIGILGNSFSGLTIEGCEVNNTTSVNGLAAGIASLLLPAFGVPGTHDLRIVNCVVQGTTSTNLIALGIVIDGTADGAENAVIKCCQVYNTVSSGTLAGGIGAADTNDVSIQNCQVYDTRGNGFAVALGIAGITLTGATNLRCNIEGCEAHNTTTELAGFGVGIGFPIGTSDVCTVKDSTALGNEFGFADFSGNNNFFAGNYAEANAVDYAVLPLPIVYTKSTGTFASTPNRWSNIQAIP